MYIIRPITKSDFEALEKMAHQASVGIINLPKNITLLHKMIDDSISSFAKDVDHPTSEKYTFVLENAHTEEIGGTCSIHAKTGLIEPNHYFKIENFKQNAKKNAVSILTNFTMSNGPSEICALYLKPEFRREGLGKLLSLSRFLFIATQKKRFEDTIVAEMRGFIKDNGDTPFWDHICRHFYDVPYETICQMELESKSFIPDLLPKWPLYVDLLHNEAKETLAKIHDKTVPALKMLENEGFTFTNEIDPFDGGPKIACSTAEIATIKNSRKTFVSHLLEDNNAVQFTHLIANTKLEYRALLGTLEVLPDGSVSIAKSLAKHLRIAKNDEIIFSPLTRL